MTEDRIQRLAEFIFFIVLALPLAFGANWSLDRLQFLECPNGTFLSGTVREGWQTIAIVLAMVSLIHFLYLWTLQFLPALRRLIGIRKGFGPRQWWNLLPAAFLLLMSIGVITDLSEYCLSATDIRYRTWPWSDMQRYQWQDIAGIETACRRGYRGRSDHPFFLIMKDGTALDIMDSPRKTEAAYPKLVGALKGHDFVFNARAVDPQCGFPGVELLIRRP